MGKGVCTNGEGGAKIEPEQNCFRDSDCTAQPICETPKNGADKTTIDFDKVEGTTCDTNYFEITNEHYYCSETNRHSFVPPGTNHYADDPTGARGTVDCRNSQNVDFPNGCCVFRPKVQVKDNWGWCNGSCATNTATVQHPNGGCYDKSWNSSPADKENECGYENEPWTTFGGKIILAPAP